MGDALRPAIFTSSPDGAGTGKETAGRRGISMEFVYKTSNVHVYEGSVPLAQAVSTPLSVTVTGENPTVAGNDGSALAVVAGGIVPYTYAWNTTPVKTTEAITGLSAGSYIVTVTDGTGATSTGSTTLVPAVALSVVASGVNPTVAGNDGSASAIASGGTLPYNYQWDTNPVREGQEITGLSAGTYTVTVEDGATFTATDSVTLV